MRGRKATLGIALAAVAALGDAPAAQASDSAVGSPICHGAQVGTWDVGMVCVDVDFGLMSVATVGGKLSYSACVPKAAICRSAQVTVGKTGFEPNTLYQGPRIYPAGPTVYWPGGTVGTLWINGSPSVVRVNEVCVGNHVYCP